MKTRPPAAVDRVAAGRGGALISPDRHLQQPAVTVKTRGRRRRR
jgi:hypothetical protein